MKRRASALASVAALVAACSGGEAEPSTGSYTVQFPSTAAAVATDFVQILVFDVKSPEERPTLCGDLIAARLTDPTTLVPSVNPPAPAANICEMRAGKKPITIPYGEHALLAIAQRRDPQNPEQLQDFMIGCAIMTFGKGDAPLPIPVKLVTVNQRVPATTCASVGEYCDGLCE
jgi:hypothetical protein